MKRTNQQGFTLLELIVSITILAMMALLISRIFTESTRAVNQGRGQSLLDETARLMLDSMETDISQALIRTNIPFRVSTVSVGYALYCISPAVRRGNETNPRDTAPVRFRSIRTAKLVQSLNRRAAFQFSSGATDPTNEGRRDLIKQSNMYRVQEMYLGGKREYTERLTETDGISSHTALTFMNFHINSDSNSNRTPPIALPSPTDMPRFVDVIIGLITADEMRQAMRIHSAQGANAADDFLERRERIYTRRIFMPNTGLTRITL